ncbi:MAG TPA: L,D-transpeptidase, partial [Symbiobacteriaceae bacterium]|nr:L,D-transpeptidase [Symbiobacteriaceae bacterium]
MLRRMAMVLLVLLLSGCTWSFRQAPPVQPVAVEPTPVMEPQPEPVPEPSPKPAPDPLEAPPPGAVDRQVGEGLKIRVLPAEGAMPTVRRTVQLLSHASGQWQVVNAVNVPHLPGGRVSFWREDLPGHAGAIVMEAARSGGVRHGAVALENGRLVALDYHRLAAPQPEIQHGVFLYLNKYMNQVWVFRDGILQATFPTANGRDPWGEQPTWKDFKENYKTPEGLFPVKQKIVNPPYRSLSGLHPPAEGGAPNNPLGTRWIGLEVFPGDGG